MEVQCMKFIQEYTVDKTGFTLHMLPTKKFKTNTIVWKMRAPLQAETATHRALLSYCMQSSTKKYPTTGSLRSYLEDLYGASFYTDLSKKGEEHIITITIEIVNEKYLKDQTPLLQKAVEFLHEVIFNPNVENGAFDAKTLEKEKRALKERIKSVFDDKMRYAAVRLVEEMCKGEPYEIQAAGELEKVDTISGEELYQYYRKVLQEDEMDVYVIGDIDTNEVENLFSTFVLSERNGQRKQTIQHKQITEVREVKEHQDVKQGKLNIGCRTNVVYGDPDYFALQMFNGIFGGFPHSKLFINVREKASLAYYAASRIESHKGLLMIMSGIDNQNYEKAVTIIKEQLQSMKNGDFTDQEVNQTKAVIRNQFLETIDSARGLIEVLYNNVISETNITIEEWLDKINAVTKEEIVSVANKVEMDTVYFLTGLEGEN